MKLPEIGINITIAAGYIFGIITSVIPTEFKIRLVGGPTAYKGRLEIKYHGKWGTVCDDSWGELDAQVVCRELGFGQPVEALLSGGYDGSRYQETFLDEVRCTGSEPRLSLCEYNLGVHNCGHHEDVSLECFPDVSLGDFSVRLVGGSYPNVGRVEVYYQNEWRRACHSWWSEVNSEVTCRQLGFAKPDHWVTYYSVPKGYAPFLNLNINCRKNESKLSECPSHPQSYHCYNPVRLQCTYEVEYFNQGDVRLVGGSYDDNDDTREGFVQVYIYGIWGTMCSSYMTSKESTVVCRQHGYSAFEMKDSFSFQYDKTVVGSSLVHAFKYVCYGDEEKLSFCSLEKPYLKCMHSDDAALICKHPDSGLSGGAIAGITIGSVVCLYFWWLCLCRRKKSTPPSTDNTTTTMPATVTNILLEPQTDANMQPTVAPMANDPPPSYDIIMQEPDRFKNPLETVETPPPAYMECQPPLNLDYAANSATNG